MTPEPIFLCYAKTICNEFSCISAKCSFACQAVLRTAGWEYLDLHPVPKEGLDPAWKWAEFTGTWHGGTEFKGTWKGR